MAKFRKYGTHEEQNVNPLQRGGAILGNVPTRKSGIGVHWRQRGPNKELHRLAWELYCRLGNLQLVSQMPLMPPLGTLNDWASLAYRRKCDCGFHGYRKPTKLMLRVKAQVQSETKRLIQKVSMGLDRLIEEVLEEALERTRQELKDLDLFELMHLRKLQAMDALAMKAIENETAPLTLTEAVDTIVKTQEERKKILQKKEELDQQGGQPDVIVGVGLYQSVAKTLVAVMRAKGVGTDAGEHPALEPPEGS